VQALLSRYYSMVAAATAAQQPPPPLVINTPGWITGLGLELLAEALRCAGPSYGVLCFFRLCYVTIVIFRSNT
jgi:polynucleotide 5'-kinase involved in rRNA processing